MKVVLFDLDGTLLPMDQDKFIGQYFKLIAKKLKPLGYDPDTVIKGIWAGTAAMVKNTGITTNEEVFWDVFSKACGEHVLNHKPIFDDFYKNEFQQLRGICGFNSHAAYLVKLLKASDIRIVLATNPLFPAFAVESRILWAGLTPDIFEFYTSYENCRHCKPNIEYYRDILDSLDVLPKDCLMVGNDVSEDMVARNLGMSVFLLTDNLINKENRDITQYANGDFLKLTEYVTGLIS